MAGPRSAKWMEILDAQVIRPPQQEGKAHRLIGHLAAGGLLLVAAALLASWIHVQSIACRYRYSQAYRVYQKRLQIRDALVIERQTLRCPQRISRIAEKELGMTLPAMEDRVRVK